MGKRKQRRSNPVGAGLSMRGISASDSWLKPCQIGLSPVKDFGQEFLTALTIPVISLLDLPLRRNTAKPSIFGILRSRSSLRIRDTLAQDPQHTHREENAPRSQRSLHVFPPMR